MKRGWERVVVRHSLITLVAQGALSQRDAGEELGLPVRQVRRLVNGYRESEGQLGSLACQRCHSPWNALPERVRQEILRLHQEYPHWSCPAIAEALATTEGVEVHRTTIYRLLREERDRLLPRHRRPDRRFQQHALGELRQMDTTSGTWLEGYRLTYVVTILDDYSCAVVACRVFTSDSSYHDLLTLRLAMERQGRPRVLYADSDSEFRLARHQRSRFHTYWPETLAGLVETEVARALRELDLQLLSHLPGNAQAKGKLERFFRVLKERVLHHNRGTWRSCRPASMSGWRPTTPGTSIGTPAVPRWSGLRPAWPVPLQATWTASSASRRSARWRRTTLSRWMG